jgi:hypothetical protein
MCRGVKHHQLTKLDDVSSQNILTRWSPHSQFSGASFFTTDHLIQIESTSIIYREQSKISAEPPDTQRRNRGTK